MILKIVKALYEGKKVFFLVEADNQNTTLGCLKVEFTLNIFCRFGCGIFGYDRFFSPTLKAQKQQSY